MCSNHIHGKSVLSCECQFLDSNDLRWRCDDDAVLQPRPVPAERGVDDVVGVGRVLGQVRPRPEGQESGVQAHKKQQVRTLT